MNKVILRRRGHRARELCGPQHEPRRPQQRKRHGRAHNPAVRLMSQAMDVRVDGAGADSHQPGDHPEDLVSLSPPQGPPGDGHEEPVDPRGGAEPVPRGGVGTEGSGDRRMQGDKGVSGRTSRAGR